MAMAILLRRVSRTSICPVAPTYPSASSFTARAPVRVMMSRRCIEGDHNRAKDSLCGLRVPNTENQATVETGFSRMDQGGGGEGKTTAAILLRRTSLSPVAKELLYGLRVPNTVDPSSLVTSLLRGNHNRAKDLLYGLRVPYTVHPSLLTSLLRVRGHTIGSRAFSSSGGGSGDDPPTYKIFKALENDELTPNHVLFDGCDYNHWLIIMEFPKDKPLSPDEMVYTYEKTCAKGLGISYGKAKKMIYACSTSVYTGFQAKMNEQQSQKFKSLPGVIFVLPDSYLDVDNKEYGGDRYENGVITPRPPLRFKIDPLEGCGGGAEPPMQGGGGGAEPPTQGGDGGAEPPTQGGGGGAE